MRRILSFLRPRDWSSLADRLGPDAARDEWAPVPSAATGPSEGWSRWLDDADPRPPAPARSRPPIMLQPHGPAAAVSAAPAHASRSSYLEHLTDEERAIIAAQQASGQPAPARSAPAPAAEPPAPRARVRTVRGMAVTSATTSRPRPRTRSALRSTAVRSVPRAGWVDVLRSYGEHLTDEELRIIRAQLD